MAVEIVEARTAEYLTLAVGRVFVAFHDVAQGRIGELRLQIAKEQSTNIVLHVMGGKEDSYIMVGIRTIEVGVLSDVAIVT